MYTYTYAYIYVKHRYTSTYVHTHTATSTHMGFVCTTMRPAVGEELDAVVAEGSGGELDVAEVAAEDLRGRRRRHGEHVHRHGRRGQRRQQPQLQRRRRRHALRPRVRDDPAIAGAREQRLQPPIGLAGAGGVVITRPSPPHGWIH